MWDNAWVGHILRSPNTLSIGTRKERAQGEERSFSG